MTNRPLKTIEQCLDKTSFSVGKIKTQDNLSEGKFPIIDQGKELIAGYSNDESLVYDGELPIIIYGDHTNIVKYIDFPFICGADGTKVFKLKNDIDTKFFVYWLEHFKPETQGYRRHYSLLKDIKFPLPPLATQKAIVAKLDETFAQIDEAIATTQANIYRADELTKSVLDKVFEEGEREKRKMGDKNVITLIMGQSPSSETYNKDGIGLPFFQGKKEFGEVYPIAEQYCSKPVKIAEAGDILMSVRAPVGPTNLADQKCCIGRGLGAIRPNKEKLITSYLLYFLKKFEKNITGLGKGSTFDAITKSDLENVEIPLPPLAKQSEIVTYLDQIFAQSSQLKSQYQVKLVELKELKASVLQGAFEGKLV